jgi:hypothetical protein
MATLIPAARGFAGLATVIHRSCKPVDNQNADHAFTGMVDLGRHGLSLFGGFRRRLFAWTTSQG